MVNIRDNSTHWRVTCNFPSGLDFTDYPRATLQATDILTFVNQDRCRKYEYISVRGQSCTDCSGMIVQRDTQHMHTDSYWSGRNGCFWDPRIGSVVGEDNFGFYNTINTQHSCTENSLSTTQWWLGAGLWIWAHTPVSANRSEAHEHSTTARIRACARGSISS